MTQPKTLCTIGSSQKSLRQFIQLLQSAGVTRVIDVRLHNTSQLAGFSKKEDLAFILETFGIEYVHLPELAPTDEVIKAFKKVDKDWPVFERSVNQLLQEREAYKLWDSPPFATEVPCLLCAEHEPTHCHRRLVAEEFKRHNPSIAIQHLT